MRWLRRILGAFVALVILFEEWGWEPLQALLGRVARLPPLAWIERRIATLPPYAALVVCALPALTVLPVKVVAVWLVARGHALTGLLVIVVAKLAGTALLARLFTLTEPALMRLAWFARWYERWLAWKNALLDQLRRSWAWRYAGAFATRVRARARRAGRRR